MLFAQSAFRCRAVVEFITGSQPASQPSPAPRNRCRLLIVIDNRPLQSAAWSELVRARKRLEKATRDVHRYEEADEPAFRAWLANTFTALLSTVRELAEKADARLQIVQTIEQESFLTGRPAARIWHEWQQHGGRPPPPPPGRPETGSSGPDDSFPDDDTVLDEELKRLFEEEGLDDDPMAGAFRDFAHDMFGLPPADARRPADVAPDIRDIYRRLVRQLHPDCGGEWTPARARLWEQAGFGF